MAYDKLALRPSRSVFALFACVCGGLAAVAIDIDHVSLWLGHPDGRIFHTPALVLACLVGGYHLARLGGLYFGIVLRNKRKRFCPTPACNKEVDRLANFCELCGTILPSLKNATPEELVILAREFEKNVRNNWKCSRDHSKVINVVDLPESCKENGGIITRYCVECGEAIDEIII